MGLMVRWSLPWWASLWCSVPLLHLQESGIREPDTSVGHVPEPATSVPRLANAPSALIHGPTAARVPAHRVERPQRRPDVGPQRQIRASGTVQSLRPGAGALERAECSDRRIQRGGGRACSPSSTTSGWRPAKINQIWRDTPHSLSGMSCRRRVAGWESSRTATSQPDAKTERPRPKPAIRS